MKIVDLRRDTITLPTAAMVDTALKPPWVIRYMVKTPTKSS